MKRLSLVALLTTLLIPSLADAKRLEGSDALNILKYGSLQAETWVDDVYETRHWFEDEYYACYSVTQNRQFIVVCYSAGKASIDK